MATSRMGPASLLACVLLCSAAMAASASAAPHFGRKLQQGLTDVDILNFALNLEYLEANFYSCAAYGVPINSSLWGVNGSAPTGCKKAQLSIAGQAYAEAITKDEIAHVTFLRAALGSAAVAQPQLDLGTAFAAAANAAFNATLTPSFDAYANDLLFYHAAFIFEDVGVTAYKGAARFVSNKDYLEAAAGILAVEAYHGGAVRTLLLQQADQVVFPYNASVTAIVQAISDLRAAVSGADDDRGLLAMNSTDYSFILAPTDSNAVAFSRTPQQVLRIVYLGGVSKGGFFPNGLNGNIKSA